jgi:hypothetical protein
MENLLDRVGIEILNRWSVTFGTSENAPDKELTERFSCITAQLDEKTNMYMLPWQVRLEALNFRAGESGEKVAKACPVQGNWDDERRIGWVPFCAKSIPTFIEATREKEVKALLKFGRDNQWPTKMTLVSAVSEFNTLSITYDVDWEGIRWYEDKEEISVTWCWSKFIAKATAEITWTPILRKENNSLWVIPREGQSWMPEDAGPPPMILYGPNAVVKMRSTAPNMVDQLMACLYTMYQGRYSIVERVATREWALVASIGDNKDVGMIPIEHRLPIFKAGPTEIRALHQQILDACLPTQNPTRFQPES